MEFSGSNNDNQAALSDVSSKNIEENPGPSSSEIPHPMAPNMAIADNDHEYGCKYCHNKFSNKQALGGHQNAHKVECAMEKNALDLHENHFAGYFGGRSSYQGLSTTNPFLGSCNRSHNFVNKYFYNYPYNTPSQQHGIQSGYNARPGLPSAGNLYAPPRHMPGFNNVYSGWGTPGPRIPQFPGQCSYNMHNHGLHLRFPNIEAGSSSSRPFSQGLSGFSLPRIRPERNIGGGQNGNQMNDTRNQQVRDDDIDLSLKL